MAKVEDKDGVIDAVVTLPPPVDGQNLVTDIFCTALGAERNLRLWPIRNPSNLGGAKWKLNKHGRILGLMLRLVVQRRGRGTLYFVPDSSGGLWINLVEAPLMRLAFDRIWFHHHVFSYIREPDWRMAAMLRILGPKVHHIVLGEAMAEGLARQYGVGQMHELGNAVFVQDVPATWQRDRLRTVGFLSNITRDKGIGLFIETMRRVQTDVPDLACLIAGPTDDPELRAEVEAFCAEAPDRRRWLGRVSGATKEDFFAQTDLLLFPTLYRNEALPVTIYEALAAGIPVLATRRGCISGQLRGRDWCLSEDGYVDAACTHIANWLADPAAFSAASTAAAESFTERQDEDRHSLSTLIETL